MRVSSSDSHPSRGNNCPPLSQLGIQILRTDIAVAKVKVVQLTIQLRELSQTSKKQLTAADSRLPRYGMEGHFAESRELHSTSSAIQPIAHIYRELYDSASSIVTEILRNPRLIVDAMAYIADSNTSSSSSGQAITGFIAVNRILHPYFTDSSATTSLLLEAIIHQTERCQRQGFNSSDPKGQKMLSSALFIQNPSLAQSWNPLEYPLPVTPNVQSETVLTTLLKLYAVRVDVTSFFRQLWIPVLPSIVAVIDSNSNSSTDLGSSSLRFRSFVKVAMRLLSHTFSEKSIISFPPAATAVSRAVYALSGKAGLYSYVFDLLIFPNIVKILSLADYDSVGGDVLKQFKACYSQKSWWPEGGGGDSVASSLIWIMWRLFSGAISFDTIQLSTLSTEDFFSYGPALDLSGMPDQRLQYMISTLGRSVRKCCQLLLHLPLDAKGCEAFDTDALTATTNLKAALPHLSDLFNSRLDSLLVRDESDQGLVLSRYEACTVFDAVSAAIGSGDGTEKIKSSKSLLREEIASYHLLERVIQSTVPVASQPVSEQMVLSLLLGSPPGSSLEEDTDTERAHSRLSQTLDRASRHQATIQRNLTRKIERRDNTLEDLLDEDFVAVCGSSSESSFLYGSNILTPRQQQEGADNLSHAHTQTSALKVTQPHRGVVSVSKVPDRASQRQAEEEQSALKRSGRLDQLMRSSQTISSYSGSRYTKVDDSLTESHLLDDTESRTYRLRLDSSPMTLSERDKLFRSSLRSPAVSRQEHINGYNDYDVSHTYPSGNDNNSFHNSRQDNRSGCNSSGRSAFSSNQYNFRLTSPRMPLNDNQGNINRSAELNKRSNNSNNGNNGNSRKTTSSSKQYYSSSSSASKSKQTDSTVKPFPEHLRVKLRHRAGDGTEKELEKEFISPYDSSDQEDGEDRLQYERSERSDSHLKGLATQQYRGNLSHGEAERDTLYDDMCDETKGNKEEGQRGPTRSGLQGQGQMSKSNLEGRVGHNQMHVDQYQTAFSSGGWNQGPGSTRDRYSPRIGDNESQVKGSEDRTKGRNLEVEFHNNGCNKQDQGPKRPDTLRLSDEEVLAAINKYQPAFGNMKGRCGPRDRYGAAADSEDPYGYLETASVKCQKSPYNLNNLNTVNNSNSEGHLSGLEGRLYSKTKSLESKLSAARADALRSPSAAFEQPAFLPWKRERSQSADKWKGRTFSKSNPERERGSPTHESAAGLSHRKGQSNHSSPGGVNQDKREASEEKVDEEGEEGRSDIEAEMEKEIETELREDRRVSSRERDRISNPLEYSGRLLQPTKSLEQSLAAAVAAIDSLPPSPSFRQPAFKPSGRGSSESPLRLGQQDDKGAASPRYSFSSKPLSPGDRESMTFRSSLSRRIDDDEFSPRSASAERVLRPSKPPGQRLSSTRPLPSYKPSPSTLSEAPNKFLREIHAGHTPGLREHEEIPTTTSERDVARESSERVKEKKENSKRRQRERSREKPVFRPSGSARGVTLEDYDGRIAESLSANNLQEVNRYQENSIDPGDSSDSSNRSPPNPPAYDLYDQYDLDHGDIRAAALEVMMNMTSDQSPCGKLTQILKRRDDEDKEEEEELERSHCEGGLFDDDSDYLRELSSPSSDFHLSSSAFRLSIPMGGRGSGVVPADPDSSDVPYIPYVPFTPVDALDDTRYYEVNDATCDGVSIEVPVTGRYARDVESAVTVDLIKVDQYMDVTSRAPPAIDAQSIAKHSVIGAKPRARSPTSRGSLKGSPRSKSPTAGRANSKPLIEIGPSATSPTGTSQAVDPLVGIESTVPPPTSAEQTITSLINPIGVDPTVPLPLIVGAILSSPIGTETTPYIGVEPVLWDINPMPRSPTRVDHEVKYDISTPPRDISALTAVSSASGVSAVSDMSAVTPVRGVPLEDHAKDAVKSSNPGIEMLKRGVVVTKHGTRGKPKRKLLKYFEITSTLHWSSIAKAEPASPQGTGWFSLGFKSPGEGKKDSFVSLSDITGVFNKESKDAKKESIKKMIKNLSQNCCLLVTDEKSLDLTFKNASEMALITTALKDLILLKRPVVTA